MGCDIHFMTEVRKDGVWVSADEWKDEGMKDMEDCEDEVYWTCNELYNGRNYDLFSILANVRNGFGFAGVDTGEGFVPIALPRGVPDDASMETKRKADSHGIDGHSHSYFTLEELFAYDWTQKTIKSGWVTPFEYMQFKLRGKPESWCGGVGGLGIHHVENDTMEEHIKKTTGEDIGYKAYHKLKANIKPMDTHYTRVEWGTFYYEAAGSFWSETIPRALALGQPQDVRFVFYFDN